MLPAVRAPAEQYEADPTKLRDARQARYVLVLVLVVEEEVVVLVGGGGGGVRGGGGGGGVVVVVVLGLTLTLTLTLTPPMAGGGLPQEWLPTVDLPLPRAGLCR
jgi:hypothetical protein